MSATATAPSRSVQREAQTDSEKTSLQTNTPQSQLSEARKHEDIARLAYTLWQLRGCPYGSPEEDWLAAEGELRG